MKNIISNLCPHYLRAAFLTLLIILFSSYQAYQSQNWISISIAVFSFISFIYEVIYLYNDYYTVKNFSAVFSIKFLTQQSFMQSQGKNFLFGDRNNVYFGKKSLDTLGQFNLNTFAFTGVSTKEAPSEHWVIYASKKIISKDNYQAINSFHEIKFKVDIDNSEKSSLDQHRRTPFLFMSKMSIFKKVDCYDILLNAYTEKSRTPLPPDALEYFSFISNDEENFGETYVHTLSMDFQINNRIHKTIRFIPDKDIDIEFEKLASENDTIFIASNTNKFIETLCNFKNSSRHLFGKPHIEKNCTTFRMHTDFNLYDVIKDKNNTFTVQYPSGNIEKN